ncbi:hypothetical protein BOX15_Mlig016649g1, partial [Macrostomum lignano]
LAVMDDSNASSSSPPLSSKDPSDCLEKERYARESHCEIERRRRNKMTAYINELCDMVPSCTSLARKPDKLTILRMAVTHMKGLRGVGNTGIGGSDAYKPSFLSDQELKHLILEAADGFLFVCQCDTGQIVYVSDSVGPVLGCSQADWLQRSLYDLVHPDDCERIQDQLSPTDAAGARILDLKTGTVKKDGHHAQMRSTMGARRAFICRMRVGAGGPAAAASAGAVNSLSDPMSAAACPQQSLPTVRMRQRNMLGPCPDGHHYAVTHVTGYLKNWPSHQHQQRGNVHAPMAEDVHQLHHQHQHYQQLHQHPHSAGSSASTSGESTVGGGVGSGSGSGGAGGHQCLVGIARLQVTSLPGGPGGSGSDLSAHSQHEFVARLSADSRISFCDQRTANVLGYQPHELLGKLFFDLVATPEEQAALRSAFDSAASAKGAPQTALVRLTTGANQTEPVLLRCCLAAFHNPYSGEFEFFVCTCTSAKSLHDAQQAAANQFYSYESSASAAPTNATNETTPVAQQAAGSSQQIVSDNNSMWFSSSATEDYCWTSASYQPYQQQLQHQPGEFHHPDDQQLMLMQQQQQHHEYYTAAYGHSMPMMMSYQQHQQHSAGTDPSLP